MKIRKVHDPVAISDVRNKPFGPPEVAFAGRSNVGKSSLLCSLVNRKRHVPISSTPGKTQRLQFVEVELARKNPGALQLVDLPGYGFARVPDRVKRQWSDLVAGYLVDNRALRLIVHVMDARHPLTDRDWELIDWLAQLGFAPIAVLTKSDKLSNNERNKTERDVDRQLEEAGLFSPIMYSAKSNRGKQALWSHIIQAVTASR